MDSHQHFNAIASDYDYWKKKNAYYHSAVKTLLREYVPEQQSVLEIGCGTGDILASLVPSNGMGIDISEGMIERAREKYPSLTFLSKDIETISEKYPHKYVILVDVLEHIDDVKKFLESVYRITGDDSTTIITLANPAWEPILEIAEKLQMKMPEGPHHRMSILETEEIFQKIGYEIQVTGNRLLIPKKIPGSDWINKNFYKHASLAPLGVIKYWVLTKISRGEVY